MGDIIAGAPCNTRSVQLACCCSLSYSQSIVAYLSRSLDVHARGRQGVKSVSHVVVEVRMFLSEAPYWSRAPRQGFWTSQRRLAINVISDGKQLHITLGYVYAFNTLYPEVVLTDPWPDSALSALPRNSTSV
jgi:hypothetical protein